MKLYRSNKSAQNLNLFFVHVPSCGGTTFWYILRQLYGKMNVVRFKQAEFRSEADVEGRFGKKSVIGGHVRHAQALGKCPGRRMITFLRDPVDRAVSHYFRHIRNKKWAPSPEHGQYDVVEFLKKNARYKQVTKYLAPPGTEALLEDETPAALDTLANRIQENISTQFASFGISEHYHRSLFLMRDMLDWKSVPTYDQRNVGGNKPSKITPEAREELEKLLRVDYKVYNFALELFEQRWESTNSDSRIRELETYERDLEKRRSDLLEVHDGRNPHIKL